MEFQKKQSDIKKSAKKKKKKKKAKKNTTKGEISQTIGYADEEEYGAEDDEINEPQNALKLPPINSHNIARNNDDYGLPEP